VESELTRKFPLSFVRNVLILPDADYEPSAMRCGADKLVIRSKEEECLKREDECSVNNSAAANSQRATCALAERNARSTGFVAGSGPAPTTVT
jgi:hypothetical protein